MARKIDHIEEHLFENKNHSVRTEYHVYYGSVVYDIKTKSQLTVAERDYPKTQIYHF